MGSRTRNWTLRAACRGEDLDVFMPKESANGSFLKPPVEQALAYCRVCPVIAECAAEADEAGDVGVWGGRYRADGQSHRSTVKAKRRHARARS